MTYLAAVLRWIEYHLWWTTCRYVDAREVIRGSLALTIIFVSAFVLAVGFVLAVFVR